MSGKASRWTGIGGGRARLGRGDCLALLPEIADGAVDLILADPPYSAGGGSSTARKADTTSKYTSGVNVPPPFLGDQKDQRSYLAWCQLWLSECWRATREGGVCLVFTDWRQLPVMSDALQAANWIWRGVIVWDKGATARPQPGRFRAQSEYVLWGTKGAFRGRGSPLPGVIAQGNITHAARRLHQTQKPVALLQELLGIAPQTATVLDPFAGSGAAGEAVLARGGTYIGIEQDAHYHQIATDRLKPLLEEQ